MDHLHLLLSGPTTFTFYNITAFCQRLNFLIKYISIIVLSIFCTPVEKFPGVVPCATLKLVNGISEDCKPGA
jgi:hypothetical protein